MRRTLSLIFVLIFALCTCASTFAAGEQWVCEVCGAENNGNFCEDCGAPRPSKEWTCPNCGRVNEMKFCPKCGAQKPAGASVPAAMPVLRADPYSKENLTAWGTNVARENVRIVTSLSTQDNAPTSAVDVSEEGDRGVLLWFEPNDYIYYNIYIAANGKMQAPEDCTALFQNYTNCETLEFNGVLDTSNVKIMQRMFDRCDSLLQLNVASFDTSGVTDMSYMFCFCRELVQIDLSSFDTSNVKNFGAMFKNCPQLQSLDIGHFVVQADANVDNMFEGCTVLPPSVYAHIASIPTSTPAPYAVLTSSEIMTPSIVIGYMGQCIRAACDGYAPQRRVDAYELFEDSRLTQIKRLGNIVKYGNSDWCIEMQFVYEGSDANEDASAGFWSVAMRDGSVLSTVMAHSIGVSSVVALLYALDPQIDFEAAADMIERRENLSNYVGNGYRLTLIIVDDTETQLLVELI